MTNTYYDFSFDNLYSCKKLETAIKTAKKDIEKLNGDINYLDIDIDYLKEEMNINNRYNLTELGYYIIEIEYNGDTKQYYISLKYKN